jgi:hypothetical protein
MWEKKKHKHTDTKGIAKRGEKKKTEWKKNERKKNIGRYRKIEKNMKEWQVQKETKFFMLAISGVTFVSQKVNRQPSLWPFVRLKRPLSKDD